MPTVTAAEHRFFVHMFINSKLNDGGFTYKCVNDGRFFFKQVYKAGIFLSNVVFRDNVAGDDGGGLALQV